MYKANEFESILGIIDQIAAEPIDDTPYNIVANPKPVVESVVDFNGIKVDTGSWSSGKGVDASAKSVGAVKVPSKGSATQVIKQDTVTDKKDDGKVTTLTTKVKAEVSDAPKAGSGNGGFDAIAKAAQAAQKAKVTPKQKFDASCATQNKAELFRGYVKSLAVDEQSARDAEKILAKFDEITKFANKK